MVYLAILLSLLTGSLVSLVELEGAQEKAVDIYQQIPEEQRRLLKEAIERLISAEKKGEWKDVYGLLEKQSGETEATFLKKMKRMRRLRDFRPYRVTFMPPDDSWNIQGCASFVGDTENQGHIADVTARWKDSRWYLSLISFVPFGDEKRANLRKCSISQTKPIGTKVKDGSPKSTIVAL